MFRAKTYLLTAVVGVLAIIFGACAPTAPAPSSVPAPEPAPATSPVPAPAPETGGTLQVRVTDAPPRHEVTSIMVTVSEVQVHKAVAEQEREQEQSASDNQTQEQEQSASGNQTQEQEQEQQQTAQGGSEWMTISLSDNATTFDLLQIQGVEQYLGESEVAAGKYTQVRLVVTQVQVALGGGELQDAEIPSRELKLVHPFKVTAGETTVMVLDFEADKMVTVTGAGKIIVKPVVKLTVRQEGDEWPKGGQKPGQEAATVTSVVVSCDEFMTDQHVSEAVAVNAGDVFKVILCSNPTTGFQWAESATVDNITVVEQTGHSFVSPEVKGNKPSAAGTPGQEVWTFRALEEGVATLSMEYSQPWEGGEKAEWTFELAVTVN